MSCIELKTRWAGEVIRTLAGVAVEADPGISLMRSSSELSLSTSAIGEGFGGASAVTLSSESDSDSLSESDSEPVLESLSEALSPDSSSSLCRSTVVGGSLTGVD